MTASILFLLAGFVALVFGGDLLVRGAVGLAEKAGVTPLVIGLVIVGLGTSMPELVASVEAALAGSPDIAWGNIVGSNISNSMLILGLTAAITPIVIGASSSARDPAVAFAATLLLAAIAISGIGYMGIGLAMIVALGLYIAWCYRDERQSGSSDLQYAANESADAPEMTVPSGWTRPVLLTLIGLAILIGGGRLLVTGAIEIARIAGLSETLIGLTIIAIGTSLPELVTSLIAAWRKQPEVAFGNVVGSNIYNVLGVGGVTMAVAPGALPATLLPLGMALMVASALVILVVGMTTGRFGRILGLGLFATYVAYIAYLVAGA